MWVKICGNTNLDDALLAADAGADAVGFVFAASPRKVTAEQVAKIIPHLPQKLEKIGIFVQLEFDGIVKTVESCALTGVQLHVRQSPHLIQSLRERFGQDFRLIQATHWRVTGQDTNRLSAELREYRSTQAIDNVLVDSRTAVAEGGTGVAFDWKAAQSVLVELAPKPLVVAGGLHPNNVVEAIAVLQPWGVDVVTGVESVPGKKDAEKVHAFVTNARSADHANNAI
jgi:phosphoribosylanthranilate isomerase